MSAINWLLLDVRLTSFSLSDSIENDEFQSKNFFDLVEDEVSGRSATNFVACPRDFKCKKLHGESKNVCCPQPNIGRSNKQTEPLDYDEAQMEQEINEDRQQTSKWIRIVSSKPGSHLGLFSVRVFAEFRGSDGRNRGGHEIGPDHTHL